MDKKQVNKIIKTVSEPVKIELMYVKEFYSDSTYNFRIQYHGIDWYLNVGTTTSATPNYDYNKTFFRLFDSSRKSIFNKFLQDQINATVTGSHEFVLFKSALELANKMFNEIGKENANPKEDAAAKLYEQMIGHAGTGHDQLTKQYKQVIDSNIFLPQKEQ